jgi:hypothetical protein
VKLISLTIDASGISGPPPMVLRRPSSFIEPCLPSKAARPPFGPLWIHEIKHDGYRLMVRRDGPRTAQSSFAAIDSIRDTS